MPNTNHDHSWIISTLYMTSMCVISATHKDVENIVQLAVKHDTVLIPIGGNINDLFILSFSDMNGKHISII